MSQLKHALRSFPTLMRVGFAGAVAYRSEFAVWVLSTTMPFVMLALFWAVAEDAPVGPYRQIDFAAYFLVTWVIRQLVSCWVVWEMNMEIRGGTLAMRLLRPIHPFLSYATDNLAVFPMRLVVSLPIVILAVFWVGADGFAHDPLSWILLPAAIIGGWAINFAANALIGTLGLFWETLSDIGGTSGADRDAMGLVAAMKMGNNKFKFHWLDADKQDNVADSGGDMWAIGVDHMFSKTALVYLNYASVGNDSAATFGTASEPESGARRALCMDEPAVRRIRNCGMRDHDLVRRKSTRVAVLQLRPRAKEGDLKTERPRCGIVQPTGNVPPLETKIGMTAFVMRETHDVARHHRGKRRDW